MGRKAMASDRVSACVELTAAKIALIREGFPRSTRDAILAELTFDHQCQTNLTGENGEGGSPELALWFAPETLSQLRFLWRLVERLEGVHRRIMAALFSDTLFTCASTRRSATQTGRTRRHHWGWVADNVRPAAPVRHDAIQLFRTRLMALDFAPPPPGEADCVVVQQDARSLAIASATVDLIVTSPPYLAMIDYVHAQRLLYTWMGWSMASEREDEIGARYRRSRRSAEQDYIKQMEQCASEMTRVLRVGGHCALVLGGSRKFPDVVGKTLGLFDERLELVWGPVSRSATRRRVSDRFASPPLEYVGVWRKR